MARARPDRAKVNEVTIDAPAKINLGLEIMGRRPDGYHEIRTVLAMLELADTVTLTRSEKPDGVDIDGVPASDNLVTRALNAFKAKVPGSPSIHWTINKRIPSAAGLGGASSDAAAALLGANVLAGSPLTRNQLAEISGTLGSDIDFFLGEPCALATGRGTDLSPVAAFQTDILLIVPRETLPAKTATMYGSLRPGDFSPGQHVEHIVAGLEEGRLPPAGEVPNAFSRALREALPRTGDLQRALETLGDLTYGLSGAGPVHYVLSPIASHGPVIEALGARFGDRLSFISTSTRPRPIDIASSPSS